MNFIWNKLKGKPAAADIELPSERVQKRPDVLGSLKKAGEGFKQLQKKGLVTPRSQSKR